MKFFSTIFSLVFFTSLLFFSSNSFSQGLTTASISGIVYDDKGETLPGANVVAMHKPSGTQYGISTRFDGRYTFPAVRTGGPYEIVVSFVGYENATLTNIYLALGQNLDLPIKMKQSGINLQEVTVSGKADAVFNSDKTGAATNVSNEQIKAIPTISRSIIDMTRLTPQSSGSSFGGRNGLYNNLSIDGSVFNNSFGLSSQPGGQTNAQPISLDAVEEIQVSLAPYDVRQGGFTGAGINAITRSGTNEFSGSIYYFFRNENFVGDKVYDTKITNNKFNQKQMGFRLGGPIIQNKLFFFVNGEIERRDDPATTLVARRPGLTGENVANVDASKLDSLRNFLIEKFNYDPGRYEGYNLNTYNDKFLIRFDYNITNRQKFSIRYNYLKSWREVMISTSGAAGGTRGPSLGALPFEKSKYTINNNIHSIIGELNSVFGNYASNNLIIGYTAFRDFRSSDSRPFPLVDILSGSNTMTSFGHEPFTPNNKLNTDVFQVSDNFTFYLGPHTLTAGFSLEYYKFENGFTPRMYGDFRYSSLNDFYADASGDTSKGPIRYEFLYSAMAGVSVPMAKIEAAQLGLYAQDEWNVKQGLKVTVGFRIDIPSYPISLPQNKMVDTLKFMNNDGETENLDVSKLPETKVMLSPRLGFNWDIFGNKMTQIRGGTGIFTGKIPFVWVSNQASNNGVMFGSIVETRNAKKYHFSDDVNKYIPSNPTLPPSVTINATSPDFSFPQVFRSNLAVDQKLPGGVVLTLEGIFTKDLNAVFHRDANLKAPSSKLSVDGRDIFPTNRKINSNINNAIVLDNTDEGYSYFLTAQLQKSFPMNFGENKMNIDVMTAYTYGETKDLTSSPSAIAYTAWSGNQVESNPNKPILSWSTFDQPHKIIGMLSFRFEYLNHFATSLSFIYTGVKGGGGSSNEAPSDGHFSYVFGGDLNGDGISYNDLIYIPKNQNEIILVPDSVVTKTDIRTPNEIWQQLNAYIEQDEYLKEHRGEIMKRNGAIAPFNSQIDLRFTQDIFMNVAGKRNTLQFTVDIVNFGNLLNSEWGVKESIVNRSFLKVLDFKGPNNSPRFAFPYMDAKNKIPYTETFKHNTGLTSLWQIQFGIRYIFN